MARRSSKNETGIERITPPEGSAHDAWSAYICLNCRSLNYVHIGDKLLTPEEAYNTQNWECEKCGFIHSKDSALPISWEDSWLPELLETGELTVERFWKAFLKMPQRTRALIGNFVIHVAEYSRVHISANMPDGGLWKNRWNVGHVKQQSMLFLIHKEHLNN